MFINGKGNVEYLSDSTPPSDKKSAEYKKWDAENNMVMLWLINSMTPEVSQTYLLHKTAAQIWEAAKESYSNEDNKAKIFSVEGIIHDLRQEEMTVTQYYTTLARYWQQLDMFEIAEWSCAVDSSKYREIIEEKHVFKFLYGLNKNLDDIQGRILSTRPIPKARHVFAEVKREESRRRIMMGDSGAGKEAIEGSALAARSGGYSGCNDT